MLEIVYDAITTTALIFINLLHNLVIPCVKMVVEFVGVNGLEHLWKERNSRIRLGARACRLAEVHVH